MEYDITVKCKNVDCDFKCYKNINLKESIPSIYTKPEKYFPKLKKEQCCDNKELSIACVSSA